MDADLANKVVVVTGASGGIGAAIARAFAEEDATVVLHYRSGRAAAEKLQRQLRKAVALGADLSDEKETARFFAQVARRFGRIDTVVANAGSWVDQDIRLQQLSWKQWKQTLDQVLLSAFLTTR